MIRENRREHRCPHPHCLSAAGTLSVVQQLVDALDPKEIDHTLEDGKTALMLACKIGHPMTAKVLLGAKADPTLRELRGKGADGFSPIMLINRCDCSLACSWNKRRCSS